MTTVLSNNIQVTINGVPINSTYIGGGEVSIAPEVVLIHEGNGRDEAFTRAMQRNQDQMQEAILSGMQIPTTYLTGEPRNRMPLPPTMALENEGIDHGRGSLSAQLLEEHRQREMRRMEERERHRRFSNSVRMFQPEPIIYNDDPPSLIMRSEPSGEWVRPGEMPTSPWVAYDAGHARSTQLDTIRLERLRNGILGVTRAYRTFFAAHGIKRKDFEVIFKHDQSVEIWVRKKYRKKPLLTSLQAYLPEAPELLKINFVSCALIQDLHRKGNERGDKILEQINERDLPF